MELTSQLTPMLRTLRLSGILATLEVRNRQAIESRMVSRRIEGAQKKVEERNFDIRKNLLEYDEVMDYQRTSFYGMRQKVLEGREIDQIKNLVEFIKRDPLSLGALVTTHKLDLLHACRDQFDRLDEFAQLMGEVSSISKDHGRLIGHAKDPITSGLALEAFLPERHWERTGAEALVLGAGGSAIAVTWHLLHRKQGRNRPARLVVTNRSTPRLDEIRRFHQQIGADIPCEYYHTPQPADTDAIVATLKPASLVINATGLGKDAPGSPLTEQAVWPDEHDMEERLQYVREYVAAARALAGEGTPVDRFTARYWLLRRPDHVDRDFADGKGEFPGFFSTDAGERRALGDDNFLNRLCGKVRAMKTGDFQITPKECETCDFGSVCRYVEVGLREEGTVEPMS